MADFPAKYKSDPLNWLEHNEELEAKKIIGVSGLIPGSYDYIEFQPAGSCNPSTILLKLGGEFGDVISTINLTYVGGEVNKIYKA